MNKIHAAISVGGRAWAIDGRYAESKIPALSEIPADFIAMRDDSIRAERPGAKDSGTETGDAVIRIDGVMMKSVPSLGGGCSTVYTRRALRQAANDPRVSRIVLVFDSPGGSVFGTADLADDVRIAATQKPVIAYIEDMCCSAALWVASQCTEIVASPNALAIGSIGVYTILEDWSKYYEEAGVLPILISSGGLKGQPVQGLEVSEEVIEDDRALILEIRDAFVGAVAAGRGMETDCVLSLADGRTFTALEAQSNGLVDRLCSWDGLFEEEEPEAATVSIAASEATQTMSIFDKFKIKKPSAPSAAEPTATPPEANQDALATQAMLAATVNAAVASKVDRLIDAGKITTALRPQATALLTAAIADGEIEIEANGALKFGATYDAAIELFDSMADAKLSDPVLSTGSVDKPANVTVEASPFKGAGDAKANYRKQVEETTPAMKENKR